MPTPAKELIVKEIEREYEQHPYAFFSSFDRLTVSDVSELRRSLEKVAGRSLTAKHAFVKKVLASRTLSEAEKFLAGQILVTFVKQDPQFASKALVDFAKKNKKFVPSGIIFEGKVYGGEFIQRLSALPSRHELLTQMVVRMKSPVSGFVMTLNAVLRGLVIALSEIKKKKETTSA
jgi:large subunit ribosomal protein L10